MTTPATPMNGHVEEAAAHAPAPVQASGSIEIAFTLEEARLLRAVAQLGMRAAGGEGANGNTPQAQSAIEKLGTVIDEAETVSQIRATLEEAGFETRLLSDAQVVSLDARLAEIRR